MPLILVGVNHKTCPIDIREKFFIQSAEKDFFISEMKNDPRVLAMIVLSTCNRTEIYADLLSSDPAIILDRFFAVKGLSLADGFEKYFYVKHEKDVVSHMFRVVTGLDSMILGEKQILGQVKCAVAWSHQRQMLNRTFNVLTNLAIETGKKVRRETLIDCGGSSISWAAVSEAQHILGDLQDKSILVIGSGKMGHLAVQELKNKNTGKIYIMNRTHQRAEELAEQFGGEAVQLWQLREVLEKVDGCICSTRAPHYLVDKELMQQVMRTRPERKFAAVDISVPRNIDPHVAVVAGVSVITVDDLAMTVQDTINKRMAAVKETEAIMEKKIGEFYSSLDRAAAYEVLNTVPMNKEACS